MNAAKIDGKIINVTIKFKFWACEHVRLKRYWRKKDGKKVKKIRKKIRKNLEKNLKKIKKNVEKIKKN